MDRIPESGWQPLLDDYFSHHQYMSGKNTQPYCEILWSVLLYPQLIVLIYFLTSYIMWKFLRQRMLLGDKNWLVLVLPPIWTNVQLEIPKRDQICNVWCLGTFRKSTHFELPLVKHQGSNLLISFENMDPSIYLSIYISMYKIPFTSIVLATHWRNPRWVQDCIDLQMLAVYISLYFFFQSVFHSLTK